MKSIALMLSVFTATTAFAVSYDCVNTKGQKLKIFQEKPDHATAIFQNGSGNKVFKGTYVYDDEVLFEVTKYDLSASNGQPAQIVVTKRGNLGRGGCGRGGCDSPVSTKKFAVLTFNAEEISFNCL